MSDRSPFPGMDPWLENLWESVHVRLIVSLCNQIGLGLPSGLLAEVETSVYVLEGGDERGRPKPDVSIFRSPGAAGTGSGASAVASHPYLISIAAQPARDRHVVIRSVDAGHPLVTAIELLSPTNKRKRLAREAYIAKRTAYHLGGVHVCEIDLVRAGGHLIDVPMDDIPVDLVTPYKGCVRRALPAGGDVPLNLTAEYYPMPVRTALPTISLPLRSTDSDLVLDLQRSVDEVYRTGQYRAKIDYGIPPDPPLSPEDAAWAAERIAAAQT
jgi:hypothetical protein